MVLAIALVLFTSVVFAVPNEGITRITDFETDNIHILRLANFSKTIVTEVEGLKTNLDDIQGKLAEIQVQIEEFKKLPQTSTLQFSDNANQVTAQLVSLESEIKNLKTDDKETTSSGVSSQLSLLFGLNIFILIVAVSTFFFIRHNDFFDEKKQSEFHAQLHLNNSVKNAIKSGVAVDKVRSSFISQGWNSERVEKSLQEAIKL